MKKKESLDKNFKELISKFAQTEIEKVKKKRAYKQEKNLPTPNGLENFSLKQEKKKKRRIEKAKIICQKTPNSALEQIYCSQNQKYPLFFIERADAFQKKKIRDVKIKEKFILARNIKQIAHQMMQTWVGKEIKILGEGTQEFYDFVYRREERHFRIDRIIRYLSDM